jgi:hypothetical protein
MARQPRAVGARVGTGVGVTVGSGSMHIRTWFGMGYPVQHWVGSSQFFPCPARQVALAYVPTVGSSQPPPASPPYGIHAGGGGRMSKSNPRAYAWGSRREERVGGINVVWVQIQQYQSLLGSKQMNQTGSWEPGTWTARV